MSVHRQLESELRFALDAARFGAWSMDLVLGELTNSATCRKIFGGDPAAPFSFRDLLGGIHPGDRAGMRQANIDSLKTGSDCEIDYRIVLPDGAERWISNRGQSLPGPDGASPRPRAWPPTCPCWPSPSARPTSRPAWRNSGTPAEGYQPHFSPLFCLINHLLSGWK